jgi:hypothetical protein
MEMKIAFLKINWQNIQQDGEDRGGRPQERDGEGAVQDQLLPGSVAIRIRIRIRRIRMFLGLLDPDPDSLVKGMDADPDPAPSPIQILLPPIKNSKKNRYSYCFVTSFWLFIFEKLCKCTFKK